MINDREKVIKIGKIIVDAQEEIGSIREVLKNLPGFPQGKVPAEVKTFHDRIELMHRNLQQSKNGCVDFLINEDTKEPQSFKHFKNTPISPNQQLLSSIQNFDTRYSNEFTSMTYNTRDFRSPQQFNPNVSSTTSDVDSLLQKQVGMRTAQPQGKSIKLPKLKSNHFHQVQLETRNLKNQSFDGRAIGRLKYDKSKVINSRPNPPAEQTKLNKVQRYNPRLDPPVITPNIINNGAESLINKGQVPRDLDMTSILQSGNPVLSNEQAEMHQAIDKKQTSKQNNRQGKKQNPPRIDQSIIMSVRLEDLETHNTEHTGEEDSEHLIEIFDPLPHLDNDEIHGDSKIESQLFHQNQSNQNMLDDESLMESEKISKRGSSRQIIDQRSNMSKSTKSKKDSQMNVNRVKSIEANIWTMIDLRIVEDENQMNLKSKHLNRWGNVSQLIRKMQKMLETLKNVYKLFNEELQNQQIMSIKSFQVDGGIILKIAKNEVRTIKDQELLDCILDNKRLYKYQQSAIKIQSWIRMNIVSKVQNKTKQLIQQSNKIKNKYKLQKLQKQTKFNINQVQESKLEKWKKIQDEFMSNWENTKSSVRFEIHIPSLSQNDVQRSTMEKFIQRQNIQLTRIFKCKDPNVKIIQILPYELSEEVFGQQWKIFELENIVQEQNKVVFLTPNSADQFPSTLSLSTLLQQSDRTIKDIKKIVGNNPAYIVPGQTSEIDQKLAVKLNLPLQCGDPKMNMLYSTKSGAKRIFNISELQIPPSAFDIYDEIEFYTTLTRLVATNIFVNRWVFKIDNEFRGRGTAYFDTENIKILEEMRKKKVDYSEAQIDKLYEIIRKNVHRRTFFAVNSLYSNFKDFMADQIRVGGIIEAAPNSSILGNPTFSFNIEPTGAITVINSYDKLLHQPQVHGSQVSPQNLLSDDHLLLMIHKIGKILFERRVFGFISIDFVAFTDPNNVDSNLLQWAIDLDIYMTDSTCIATFQDFLLNGTLSPDTNLYTVKQKKITEPVVEKSGKNKGKIEKPEIQQEDQERHIVYIPYVQNKGLTVIQQKTFFHMCRIENISQDLETKKGTIFLLSDSLQGGCLGLICIGESRSECINQVCTAFNFVETQTNSKFEDQYADERTDKLSFRNMNSIFKILKKKNEEKRIEMEKEREREREREKERDK